MYSTLNAANAQSRRYFPMLAIFAALSMILILVLALFTGTTKAADQTQAGFDRTWERTDMVIKMGRASRTWIWGPQVNHTATEAYQQSPTGSRPVMYWDKSRMEVNNPGMDSNSKWYVTNGLLVKEMISGQIQVGDAQFIPYHPSDEALAGDSASINTLAPTYRSLQSVASLDLDKRTAQRSGQPLMERIDQAGNVTTDPRLASYGVTYNQYEQTLGHNFSNVFIEFFSKQGPVMENGKMVNSTVFEWLYAAGLPLTDPYWMQVKVGGVDKDVLVQAFERRVVTYTPSNAAGWQVEMGNVGLHYYAWRYPVNNAQTGNNPSQTNPGGSNNGGSNNGGGNGTATPAPGNGGGNGTATPTPAPGNGGGNGGGTATPTPGNGGGTATPTPGNGGETPTPTPTPTTPATGCISISAGSAVTVNAGGSASVPVNVSTTGCFSGTVNLGVSGSNGTVSANLSSNSVVLGPNATANLTLTVNAAPGATPGNTSLNVTASTNVESVSTGVNVSLIIPGDFSVSANGNVTLKLKSSANVGINLQAMGGFSGPVSLSVSGASLGINASLTNSVNLGVNGAASANLSLTSSSTVGVAVLVITGTSNGKTHSATVTVTVTL